MSSNSKAPVRNPNIEDEYYTILPANHKVRLSKYMDINNLLESMGMLFKAQMRTKLNDYLMADTTDEQDRKYDDCQKVYNDHIEYNQLKKDLIKIHQYHSIKLLTDNQYQIFKGHIMNEKTRLEHIYTFNEQPDDNMDRELKEEKTLLIRNLMK